jgi:hypothetical protein
MTVRSPSGVDGSWTATVLPLADTATAIRPWEDRATTRRSPVRLM